MARKTTKRESALQDLIGQLEDTAKQAGDRISEYLAEARVRQRLTDAADAINDVRLTVLRRIHGEPPPKPTEEKAARAATPLEDMTIRELHKLRARPADPRAFIDEQGRVDRRAASRLSRPTRSVRVRAGDVAPEPSTRPAAWRVRSPTRRSSWASAAAKQEATLPRSRTTAPRRTASSSRRVGPSGARISVR